MPFIEAFRQFQFRVGRDNFCVVHVSLIPEVGTRLSPKESFEEPFKLLTSKVRKKVSFLGPQDKICHHQSGVGDDGGEGLE